MRSALLPILAAAAFALPARAVVIELDFSTLPSAQGWTYSASGNHAGEPEADIFAVNGSVLDLNSIGDSHGLTGGSAIYKKTGTATNQAFTWDVRAALLETQVLLNQPAGHTLDFAVRTNYGYFFYTLNNDGVRDSDVGFHAFASGFDETQFHDYRWIVDPAANSAKLYIDGTLFLADSRSTTFNFHTPGDILFGDGTGGSDIHAQISYFRFTQGEAAPDFPSPTGAPEAVPEPGTLVLLGLGLAALAWRKRRKSP